MLPIKKTLSHPKADPERRFAFCRILARYRRANRPIVYLDESGFAHDMPRAYGYSRKGKRCYGSHDWGAKGRTNAIGALWRGYLLTVSLFSSTINTVVFTQWIQKDLIPKLPPQSVVVLDNASFHKGCSMKQAIADAGHTLLYLPPYSPDLNPIEHKWAQAKSLRRQQRCEITQLFKNHTI